MYYTINRIDTGKPACDQHGPVEAQTPKEFTDPAEAQRWADAGNINALTWMVVPHAEGSKESMEASNGRD